MQEKNPLKAINSFAIRDVIDGFDSPLIVLEAGVFVGIGVSVPLVSITVTGGFTIQIGELCHHVCQLSIHYTELIKQLSNA